jgi:hypothetical protein
MTFFVGKRRLVMEKAGQLTGIGANINGDNAIFGI